MFKFKLRFLVQILLLSGLLFFVFGLSQTHAAGTNDFVITVKTDNYGPSSDTSFRLPITSGTYDVDWNNDGTFDQFGLTGIVTHDYGVAGTYTIRVYSTSLDIYFYGNDVNKLLSIDQWGTTQWAADMSSAFRLCSNLVINATDSPNLSNTTNISLMFYYTSALTNEDLSGWNTSNITKMENTFGYSKFNGDISTWNVSNVTTFKQMFQSNTVFNGDISGWTITSATDLSYMFSGAYLFNQDISGWDTTGVTTISSMFNAALAFNQDITGWDISGVTSLSGMFSGATSFNQDITLWDTSNITNFGAFLNDATSFNQDLSGLDISSATYMAYMLGGDIPYIGDISGWDISQVTDISGMFSGNSTFNQDISSWNVGNVTNFGHLFYQAYAFNQDISSWDLSSALSTNWMFLDATSFNQNISSWDVSSVTNMSNMFGGADSFNQDISSWDVSSVTNMSYMFSRTDVFNQDISIWDVSSVTNMSAMFDQAQSFNQDISTWDVSGVTNMSYMFRLAQSFDQDISTWTLANGVNLSYFLYVATGFNQDLSGLNISNASSLTQILNYSGMDILNYESTLIAWSQLASLPSSVNFITNYTYCTPQSLQAVNDLISNYSWVIDNINQSCNTVQSLSPNLSVKTSSGSINLQSTTSSIIGNAIPSILGKNTGEPIALIDIDLGYNRDWSSVSGDVNIAEGKSVVLNLTSAPGAASTHSLYIPKIEGTNGVVICPEATTIYEVNSNCTNGYQLSQYSQNVSVVTINFQDYYLVSGLTGTGGIGEVGILPPTILDVVLKDSDQISEITDIELWITTFYDITADTLFYISYDTSFTGGSLLTKQDMSIYCDADGLLPLDSGPIEDFTIVKAENGFIELNINSNICNDTTVIDIHGNGGNSLSNPATAGNYYWSFSYDLDGNGFINGESSSLVYVGNLNEFEVGGYVASNIEFSIYEAGTENLLGGTGANICSLGLLTLNEVSTCSYDLATGTNSATGVSILITSDGDLRTGGGDTIDACSGFSCDSYGTTGVNAGHEEYGIYISDLGAGEYKAENSFNNAHQTVPIEDTLFATTSASGSGTTAGNIAKRLEVTHAASVNESTPFGNYNQIITYTVYTN